MAHVAAGTMAPESDGTEATTRAGGGGGRAQDARRSRHAKREDGTDRADRVLRRQLIVGATTIAVVRIAAGVAFSKAATASFGLGPFFPGPLQSWTTPFLHWDAGYFLSIAQHGYTTVQSYDFLPLYPLLIRAVSPVFGYAGGALVVSWIASVFAVWGVMDVTARPSSRQTAWLAGTLLMWNPLSVFLLAGYAEALLVALMIWSLRFCMDRRWWPAAITAGLASAVLPQGIASAVVLVLALLLTDRSLRGWLKAAGLGLVGLAGMIGYVLYCWTSTGNPFKIRQAETVGWEARITYPLHMVFVDLSRLESWHFMVGTVDVSKQMRVIYALDVAVGLLAVALAVAGFVLCRWEPRLLLPACLFAVGLLISLVTIDAAADSSSRFILFLAPLYVIVAVLLHKIPPLPRFSVVTTVLMLSAASAVFFGAVFNLGYWLT